MALLLSGVVAAQYSDPDVDWKENSAPEAPAFDATRLIAVGSPRGSTLKFGIDPNTISIGSDGVVRYVVVATGASGAASALFEGIRCGTGEFRVYARHNTGDGWSKAGGSAWTSIFAEMPSRHTLAIARAGVCDGKAPNGPISAMVRALRASAR